MSRYRAFILFNTLAVEGGDWRHGPQVRGHSFLPIFAAVSALLLGLLVYAFDRPLGSAYLLPAAFEFDAGPQAVFGTLGGVLPSFVHTFAFGLLTAMALRRGRRAMFLGAGAWWMIGTLFEIGQHRALSGPIAALFPVWFGDWPLLDHAAVYFSRGTFDPLDALATALGAASAMVFFHYFILLRGHYE